MPEQAETMLDTMLADASKLAEAAEEVLDRAARRPSQSNGRPSLTAQERNLLRIAGYEEDDFTREVSRVASVHRHMERAGSDLDYAQAQAADDDARERLRTEGPSLREAIAAAERQLCDLEQAVRITEEDVSGRAKAREALKGYQLMPRHIQEQFRDAQQGEQPTRQELARVEGEIRFAETIQDFDANSVEALNVVRVHKLDDCLQTTRSEAGLRATSVVPEKWYAYRSKRKAEIPALERRRAELAAEVQRLNDGRGRLLGYYLAKLA